MKPMSFVKNLQHIKNESLKYSKIPIAVNLSMHRSIFQTTWYGILLLLLALHFNSVDALPSFLNPVRGSTLAEEIQCYSIPYGGIGFTSHLITYHTLIMVWMGRQPLRPWLRMKSIVWDCFVGILTFITANALAVFTLIRCRNRWEFVLIAVW